MIRFSSAARIAAIALFGAGLAGGALATERGPRIVGSGENLSVEYPAPSANVVGGALTRSVGSGEGVEVQVIQVQAMQSARIGHLVGSGENQHVVYEAPAEGALRLAAGQQPG
jgi:hypothetical protein